MRKDEGIHFRRFRLILTEWHRAVAKKIKSNDSNNLSSIVLTVFFTIAFSLFTIKLAMILLKRIENKIKTKKMNICFNSKPKKTISK